MSVDHSSGLNIELFLDVRKKSILFLAGFSLSSLTGCKIRTLILTSGTLKPIDSFCSELDADFPVTLENGHVIDPAKQICYQVT